MQYSRLMKAFKDSMAKFQSLQQVCCCVVLSTVKLSHGCAHKVTWLCPQGHMVMSTRSHGCAHKVTWLCPQDHMAVPTRSHGCAHKVTWLCPQGHMAVPTRSHGCAHKVT